MRILNLIIIVFCLIHTAKGQWKAKADTFYYPNHTLNVVHDYWALDAVKKRYYKQSNNKLDWNIPVMDSSFSITRLGNHAPHKGKKIYLPGNAAIYIGQSPGGYLPGPSVGIGGSYKFFFPGWNGLQIELNYTSDTSIAYIDVTRRDTFDYSNYRDRFISFKFREPGKFSWDSVIGQVINCGQLGTLRLICNKTGLLEELHYYGPNYDVDRKVKYYKFHDNLYCKAFGSFKYLDFPVGEWKEYYKNGNIKNIGNYELDPNEANEKHKMGRISDYAYKQGLWQFFDEEGNLSYEEWYERDKVIKTKKYDAKR